MAWKGLTGKARMKAVLLISGRQWAGPALHTPHGKFWPTTLMVWVQSSFPNTHTHIYTQAFRELQLQNGAVLEEGYPPPAQDRGQAWKPLPCHTLKQADRICEMALSDKRCSRPSQGASLLSSCPQFPISCCSTRCKDSSSAIFQAMRKKAVSL